MMTTLRRAAAGAPFLRALSSNQNPKRNHPKSLQTLLKPTPSSSSSSSVIISQFHRVSTMSSGEDNSHQVDDSHQVVQFALSPSSALKIQKGSGEDNSHQVDDSHQVVQFALSPSSALKIQKGDITQWFVDGSSDAIVNPADEKMLGGGGADGAIHRAAGPELREACYKVPEVRPGVRCPTGEARITPGFKLPASHVIYTVGPIYDVDSNPEASLKSAYRNSLRIAKENNIQYIAFPAISCGVFRYPLDEAATVALSSVKEFAKDIKEVHFVLFSDEIYNIWWDKAKELLQN